MFLWDQVTLRTESISVSRKHHIPISQFHKCWLNVRLKVLTFLMFWWPKHILCVFCILQNRLENKVKYGTFEMVSQCFLWLCRQRRKQKTIFLESNRTNNAALGIWMCIKYTTPPWLHFCQHYRQLFMLVHPGVSCTKEIEPQSIDVLRQRWSALLLNKAEGYWMLPCEY